MTLLVRHASDQELLRLAAARRAKNLLMSVLVSYLGAVPGVVYVADPATGQSAPVLAAGFVTDVPSDLVDFLRDGPRT